MKIPYFKTRSMTKTRAIRCNYSVYYFVSIPWGWLLPLGEVEGATAINCLLNTLCHSRESIILKWWKNLFSCFSPVGSPVLNNIVNHPMIVWTVVYAISISIMVVFVKRAREILNNLVMTPVSIMTRERMNVKAFVSLKVSRNWGLHVVGKGWKYREVRKFCIWKKFPT